MNAHQGRTGHQGGQQGGQGGIYIPPHFVRPLCPLVRADSPPVAGSFVVGSPRADTFCDLSGGHFLGVVRPVLFVSAAGVRRPHSWGGRTLFGVVRPRLSTKGDSYGNHAEQ